MTRALGAPTARHRLFALALFWLVFAILPEIVLAPARLVSRGAVGVLIYFLSAVGSFVSWWLLASFIAWSRERAPKIGWVWVVVVGPVGTLLTVASIHYRLFFDTDIRPIAIAYFLENPRYALGLVAESMTPLLRVGFMVICVASIAFLLWVTRHAFRGIYRPHPAWLIVAVAPVALVSIPALGFSTYPCLAEVRSERAIVQGLVRRGWSEPLHALPIPHRVPVQSSRPESTPDIVLIIGESLGAQQIAPWNGGDVPNEGLIVSLGSQRTTVWLEDAVSVAPVTAVSVPSLLSGLAPDAPSEDYARAPLIWHEARARGYRSAFFSAQDFHVDFFEGFYLSDGGPDESKNASSYGGAPRVNDRGVPDARAIDDAISFAERSPRDRPILLIVQMNATHWPCWSPEDTMSGASIPVRCARAVRYVESETTRLALGLKKARGLENTVVIVTSDHGESFDATRPARAVNYYQSVLRVPLLLSLPESLCARSKEACATLSENRSKRASNLDVFPTILDLWGSQAAGDRPSVVGQSLLRPLPVSRVLLSTAVTAIWDSFSDGFALYDGRRKWIIDELHGVRLFDTAADPGETENLADSAPADAIETLKRELGRHPRALDTFRRVAPGQLEGAWAPRSF